MLCFAVRKDNVEDKVHAVSYRHHAMKRPIMMAVISTASKVVIERTAPDGDWAHRLLMVIGRTVPEGDWAYRSWWSLSGPLLMGSERTTS